ncbi:zinc ABC transporter substrate-binding protein [Candidatus Bathyarchaeota archaeon]|nr:zinc ABC transporter substrate-binding protein [Candidatus Bathyarchaeota archaeon]
MKVNEATMFLAALLILSAILPAAAAEEGEKPIIVCTTNVLGSIVKEIAGDDLDVIVLVNPSLCPTDYDMKPSDIYALSKAKILFYHDIPGEKPWLGDLIEAAVNEDLMQVKVPGTYNTPAGAKSCIRIIGGNLSMALSKDFSSKVSSMLDAADSVADEIRREAQSLGVEGVSVICMKWQKTFVEWIGFKVVATYDPPETLSASDIANIIDKARNESAALIIDNLQISAEFGASIASEVGAEHVVLTNFPGAIPGTGNLTQMFRYNAKQLFEGLRRWRAMRELEMEVKKLTESLKAEAESLKNQLAAFQAATFVAATVAAVEFTLLLAKRRGAKPK